MVEDIDKLAVGDALAAMNSPTLPADEANCPDGAARSRRIDPPSIT